MTTTMIPTMQLRLAKVFDEINGKYVERLVLQQYQHYAHKFGGEWVDVPIFWSPTP